MSIHSTCQFIFRLPIQYPDRDDAIPHASHALFAWHHLLDPRLADVVGDAVVGAEEGQ